MKTYVESVIKDYFPCFTRPYKKVDNDNKRFIPYICFFFILFLGVILYHRQLSFGQSIWYALEKSILLILSIYIMKELEPDMKQNYIATFFITAFAILFILDPDIIGAFSILLCARILNRSSGFKASFPELFLILFIGFYLFFFGSNTYPLIISAALFADFLNDKKNKKDLIILVPLATISILGFFRSLGYLVFLPRLTLSLGLLFAIITMMFALRISFIKRIYTSNDTGLKALSPRRIKALNTIVLLGAFIESYAYGNGNEFLYIWAIAFGISVPYLKDIKHILKAK